ncbi:MAG TPA: AraC family transcriptional regulator [Chitinophagales bacterium]|nr:AraC family transcriptional regulator [Chitinophagales bacterium]
MAIDLYPKVYLYRRIVQAKMFIDEHFSEPLDLNNIADEAFFSKFHFLRLFKNAYGRTPHQYLTLVRVQRAKELLKNKNTTASQACFDVGFESITSFTSLFKRHTGSTPASFQKLQLQLLDDARTEPLKFVPNCFATAKSRFLEKQF